MTSCKTAIYVYIKPPYISEIASCETKMASCEAAIYIYNYRKCHIQIKLLLAKLPYTYIYASKVKWPLAKRPLLPSAKGFFFFDCNSLPLENLQLQLLQNNFCRTTSAEQLLQLLCVERSCNSYQMAGLSW